MRIIIDANSILEIVEAKNMLLSAGYKGEICVMDNTQIRQECAKYNDDFIGIVSIQELFGLRVVG